MLANVAFYVALLSAVTAGALSAGLAMARIAVHRAAESYVAAGIGTATSRAQQTLAQQMQSGAGALPVPEIAPIGPACADSATPCRFLAKETITLAPAQSDALNEQSNTYISEDRITAHVVVSIAAQDGTALVTRASDTVFRLIRTPPYVVVAGARDATFDDAIQAGAGDDGGGAPATPDPCGSSSPGTAADTEIRVAYENAVTGACSDGSTWRSATAPPATAAPWSP